MGYRIFRADVPGYQGRKLLKFVIASTILQGYSYSVSQKLAGCWILRPLPPLPSMTPYFSVPGNKLKSTV